MAMIANAGMHYASNPADDYRVQSWYNHPWDAVLRPNDEKLANLAANMAIAAANNDNVIYIWGGTSYHQQLASCNYDPAAISTQCGTDCMGSVFANIKGAMHRLGMDPFGIPDMGTFNADTLISHGFTKFTDSDHVATDANAKRGDVYVNYAQHACMFVGDGNLNGYNGSSSSGSSSSGVNLNLKAMSPYVVVIPEEDSSFDPQMLKSGQVCGVGLWAGSLYPDSRHVQTKQYIARNLHAQAKIADNAQLPFALIADVRSRTVGEAKIECEKLYYVCASHVPKMGLWLHLGFNNSKQQNERILDYYVEECSKWGFKNSLGVYVAQAELDGVDWGKYSSSLYLWKQDHSVDVGKYVGVLPFAEYHQSISSLGSNYSSSGSAQDLASANQKQKAIVAACKSTPSPGAGLCAAWITYVYMNAGAGHPSGNACDMYYQYCTSSNKSDLKVGMLVAVPSYSGNEDGQTYGHVAIYIGGGQVMDNIGYVNTQSLDSWLQYYGNTHTPKWGFGGSGIA